MNKLYIVLILFLVACQGNLDPAQLDAQGQALQLQAAANRIATQNALPTGTPLPTSTPLPTMTPAPTVNAQATEFADSVKVTQASQEIKATEIALGVLETRAAVSVAFWYGAIGISLLVALGIFIMLARSVAFERKAKASVVDGYAVGNYHVRPLDPRSYAIGLKAFNANVDEFALRLLGSGSDPVYKEVKAESLALPDKGINFNKQHKRVIHPLYGIDPLTLPELPTPDLRSVMVTGGSRSGKTNAVLSAIHKLNISDLTIYDPKLRPNKWPSHAKTICEPAELHDALRQATDEFKSRRDSNSSNFQHKVIVVDEYSALIALAKYENRDVINELVGMLLRLVMMGAEFKITPWILSQSASVKANGLDGQGDLRDSLTSIRFNWAPNNHDEYNIPRIAIMNNEKYHVPYFEFPSSSAPVLTIDGGSSENHEKKFQNRTEPSRTATEPFLQAVMDNGIEWTQNELETLLGLRAQGVSGHKAKDRINRSKADFYKVWNIAKEYING